MKQAADEYRRRAEVCLSWAQHVPADDVRLSCVALAMAWLKAAEEDNQDRDVSPPALRV